MDGKFVSYLRVSTQEQGRSGLGLEAQQAAIAAYLNGGNWTLLREFREVESGKDADRPALQKALALCRTQDATLLIAKLDRLSRNVAFIASLMDSGVRFVAVDMPTATPFMLHVYAAVAQEERRLISERTKAALAALKVRGCRLGRPNVSQAEWAKIAAQGRERSILVRRAKAQERKQQQLLASDSQQHPS